MDRSVNIMSAKDTWVPRSVQEARLQGLEYQLASKHVTIDIKIEHAVLLSALDRRVEAQQAFIDILLRSPTHFTALNEFGNFLVSVGLIAAACRVYSEAVTHHPVNPTGHVNLANLLLHGGDLAGARSHYETALRLNPNHPQAHQGLGAVLSGFGDHGSAKSHFQKGFCGHFISTLPYRGTKPPISVLLLVSSGSGNIPTGPFLDDRLFMTSVIVADYLRPLGPAASLTNWYSIQLGMQTYVSLHLKQRSRLMKRTSAPIINDPSAVLKTGRIANTRRLRALKGVRTPQMIGMPRSVLTRPRWWRHSFWAWFYISTAFALSRFSYRTKFCLGKIRDRIAEGRKQSSWGQSVGD